MARIKEPGQQPPLEEPSVLSPLIPTSSIPADTDDTSYDMSVPPLMSVPGKLISGGRMSWRQDDAINSTDSSDSDSECSLVEFEDNNISEDEEILTLERLSI